jgi:hypothetical protein
MSSVTENLKANFVKPLVAAAVGGFLLEQEQPGGSFRVNTGTGLPIDGSNLTSMTFGAVLGLGSSFLVESLNNITNAIDKKHRTKHLASFVTHSFGAMASWALIAKALNPSAVSNKEMMSLAKVGFISEIFSQWVHENFIEADSFGQDVMDLL